MVGNEFEDKVVLFLKHRGHKILVRNFYSRWGELDIVSQRKKDIFFVEVRARKVDSLVSAVESVDYHKRKKIVATALYFLSVNRKIFEKGNWSFHFSVAAVENGRIKIIWDAFGIDEFGL